MRKYLELLLSNLSILPLLAIVLYLFKTRGFKAMMKEKTTWSGIASIIGGIGLIINGQVTEGVVSIVTGLGLIAAADRKKETTQNPAQ